LEIAYRDPVAPLREGAPAAQTDGRSREDPAASDQALLKSSQRNAQNKGRFSRPDSDALPNIQNDIGPYWLKLPSHPISQRQAAEKPKRQDA
jgi:hypothetical protein